MTTTAEVTATSTPTEIDTRLLGLWWEQARYQALAENDKVGLAEREAAVVAFNDLAALAAPLEAAYNDRRWTRWYWVPQGHLHREGQCSTLYASTDRNLTPAASGMDDAQVVKRYGWHVCTVCVPNAPVLDGFRTPGTYAAAEAAASGDCLNKYATRVTDRGWTAWGSCGECGARGVAVTSLGNLRKHKHQRVADDAARQARINDPKLIGTPDGDVLKVDGDVLRTVRTAEIAYVDALFWAEFSRRHHDAADPRHLGNAEVIAKALAAKAGTTPEQVAERLAKRVARKVAEVFGK